VKLHASSQQENEVNRGQFDVEAFYAALDSQRQAKNLNWKQVAKESGVSASTLTRIAQGRRPDVDSMAVLLNWSGLEADSFVRREQEVRVEPLAQISAYLRADPQLTSEAAAALDAVIKVAYEKLRKMNVDDEG
jgi:transcriptional regulator with XRE-family HTH domain